MFVLYSLGTFACFQEHLLLLLCVSKGCTCEFYEPVDAITTKKIIVKHILCQDSWHIVLFHVAKCFHLMISFLE